MGAHVLVCSLFCIEPMITRFIHVRNLLEEYGVKIRFIGQLDLLPPDVLQAVRDMEAMTQDNKK